MSGGTRVGVHDLSDPTTVSLLRMVGLGLGTVAATLPEEVSRIGALQSQDWRGALHTLALRTAARSIGEATAAFDTELVRTWPMRGTLHTVARSDLPWLLALTSPRMFAQAARRRAQLGIDDTLLDRASGLAREALAERPRGRDELVGLWAADGVIDGVPQRGYHLVMTLCHEGLMALGPVVDGAQLLVPLDLPLPLDPPDPATTFCLRYFTSHGPATMDDLVRWCGLTKSVLGPAARRLREDGVLATTTVAGRDLWHGADLAQVSQEALDACRTMVLASGFEELVLGYRDRTCTVPPSDEARICPGNNGMFKHTVIENGRVIGTWTRPGGRDPVPDWFVRPSRALTRRFDAACARMPV